MDIEGYNIESKSLNLEKDVFPEVRDWKAERVKLAAEHEDSFAIYQ